MKTLIFLTMAILVIFLTGCDPNQQVVQPNMSTDNIIQSSPVGQPSVHANSLVVMSGSTVVGYVVGYVPGSVGLTVMNPQGIVQYISPWDGTMMDMSTMQGSAFSALYFTSLDCSGTPMIQDTVIAPMAKIKWNTSYYQAGAHHSAGMYTSSNLHSYLYYFNGAICGTNPNVGNVGMVDLQSINQPSDYSAYAPIVPVSQ